MILLYISLKTDFPELSRAASVVRRTTTLRLNCSEATPKPTMFDFLGEKELPVIN